jgi:predicted aldo/keto reductase-like oxidoreductase
MAPGLSTVDEALSASFARPSTAASIFSTTVGTNDGASEIRMGHALKDGYRQKAFVMTKIDGRSKAEATTTERIGRRLGTDCIDLVQHHEVIRFEDPHRIFDEEGAQRRADRSATGGKLRYIGFTG